MTDDLLPHLETFSEAAELGSFTGAAKKLGLTQAAISQRIQQLESTLGSPLFKRSSGRITLTAAGRKLHDYAHRIIDLHAEARSAVTGTPREITGELILAASSIPGEHILPALLAAFRSRYPKISVRLVITDSALVLRQIERGEAHLGFVGNKQDLPQFEYRPFACDRLVLVVSPRHKWRRRKRTTVAELVKQPLIQREHGSGSRVCLEVALSAAGYSSMPIEVSMELGSNEAIKQAVSQGLGVAVLSKLAVEQEVAAKRLHALEITGISLKRKLFAVRNLKQVLPTAAQLFLTFLPPASY